MKERPIIFTGESVRAILEGRKTQTRRVVTPQPPFDTYKCGPKDYECLSGFLDGQIGRPVIRCHYGQPGDRLWVRETWNFVCDLTPAEVEKRDEILGRFFSGKSTDIVGDAKALPLGSGTPRAMYAADFGEWAHDPDSDLTWKSSMLMPRWASRITLEITGVRVERVQDAKPEDLWAEGCPYGTEQLISSSDTPQSWFKELWDSINAKRGYGWEKNPWAWVIEFKRM